MPRLIAVDLSSASRRITGTFLAAVLLVLLAGCGASSKPSSQGSSSTSVPGYVSEPFSAQQRLIEQGARLVVSDGCSACHLMATARNTAPSFASFAGHRFTLTNGRSVIVNERFVKEALLHPDTPPIKGFNPAPMLQATKHLNLPAHAQQVAALAAFIEQIGPEPG